LLRSSTRSSEAAYAPEARVEPKALTLRLDDGTEFHGTAFGADTGPVAGEVVFNTAMCGYVEALTDPSYRGQMLVLTYPIAGSYGVPAPRASRSIDAPFESAHIQVQALIVQHYQAGYSHHAASRSLASWLGAEGVAAITGIDTRALTRRLREVGTMRGLLFPRGGDPATAAAQAASVRMQDEVFRLVAPAEPVVYEGGPCRAMLIDVGAKDNIVRSLAKRGLTVDRVPWHADLAARAAMADGIVIGNGPGDPQDLKSLVAQLRGLLATFHGPIFGVCLGNQLLALAAGARTFKLRYGHRGINQPVQDLLTRRCLITSQNHGYAVHEQSLPAEWEPWFVNLNDGTNEGIRARGRPFSSVQFHPESSPGPRDADYLFEDFVRLIHSMRKAA
jgi:carbamoyl-phosphate synthase small subunit